jgi:CRP-like cAMP-binding protein
MLSPVDTASVFCAEVSKLPGVVRRHFATGRVVAVHDSPEVVHQVIESGGFAFQILRENASREIVEILGRGSCVLMGQGDSALRGHDWSLLALRPTTVLEMPKEMYFRALRANHALAVAAVSAKARQHAALLRHTAALHGGPPMQRIASSLLYLAEEIGERCPLAPGTRVLLAQELVSATARVTRQTGNRELQRLRAGRHIHVSRATVCVIDRQGLGAMASGQAAPRTGLRPCRCKLVDPNEPLDCVEPATSPSDLPGAR